MLTMMETMRLEQMIQNKLLVRQGQDAGFTLIELMATIAIMAFIIIIAAPTYKELTISSEAAAQANSLLGNLNHARSEAAKRGMKVVVCKSANGSTCDTVAANGWEEGRIEFVDVDGDNIRTVATEALISAQPAIPDFTITGTGVAANYLSFFPSGFTRVNVTLNVCSASRAGVSAPRHRAISIIASGRARITVSANQTSCP